MRNNTLVMYILITQLLVFFSCKTNTTDEARFISDTDHQLSLATIELIDSDILGEEREVWVHVPSEFYGMDTTDVRFPVIYVVDADGHFLPLAGIADQLSSRFSANDECPPHIVVGIRNPNRNFDLTPPRSDTNQDSINGTGGAYDFVKFIENELMPIINSKYPVAPYTTLAGHSLGGLFVLSTLIENQDLFDNYLAIDPAMDWDDRNFLTISVQAFKTKSFDDKKLYIVGAGPFFKGSTIDQIKKDTSSVNGLTTCVLLLKDELDLITPKGLNVKFEMEMDENHYTVPLKGFPQGLKHIYDGYHFDKMVNYYDKASPQRQEDIIEAIEEHYANISARMGYDVKPLESYINSWAMGYGYNGEPEFGAKLYDYNIKNYPSSPFVHMANGHFKLSQEDTSAAIASFQNSLKLSDDVELTDLIAELNE